MMPKCILIADDSLTIRTLIRSFLENETRFEICGEAIDGVDAIEKARSLKPALILLDLMMPKMNGAEAASILKQMMPEVPIILFTMYDDAMVKGLSSESGVDVVLSKPDGMGQMVQHVQRLLA
jgi:DNA-binding NarL/FixJ family response regulator